MAASPRATSLLLTAGGCLISVTGFPAGFVFPLTILGLSAGIVTLVGVAMIRRRPAEQRAWGVAIVWFASISVIASGTWLAVGLGSDWNLGIIIGLIGLVGNFLGVWGGVRCLTPQRQDFSA